MRLTYEQITQGRTPLHKVINKKGQSIELYDHPTLASNMLMIAVHHESKTAKYCEFFDYSDDCVIPVF